MNERDGLIAESRWPDELRPEVVEIGSQSERRGIGWFEYHGGIYPVAYTLDRRREKRRPGATEDLPEFSGTLDLTALGDDAGPIALRIRDDGGEQWLMLEDGEEIRISTTGTQGRSTLLRYVAASC